jgi:hypothetical protein
MIVTSFAVGGRSSGVAYQLSVQCPGVIVFDSVIRRTGKRYALPMSVSGT